jgi:hypothetical protein
MKDDLPLWESQTLWRLVLGRARPVTLERLCEFEVLICVLELSGVDGGTLRNSNLLCLGNFIL